MKIISEHVNKTYIFKDKLFKKRKITAIEDFNYTIEQGEIIGLLGLDNSGKSTIVSLLSGSSIPTSGCILVDGKVNYKVLKNNSKILLNLTEKKGLSNDTVYNNLAHTGNKLKFDPLDAEKRITELRDILELDKSINVKTANLSALEIVKLNIAISIFSKPCIVFFDNALNSLDSITKSYTLKLLKRINKEFKTTIVIATNNINDIEKICKRVTILTNGKVLMDEKYEIVKEKYFNNKNVTVLFNKSFNIPKGDFEVLENNDYYLKVKIDFNKCDFATFINQFDINTIVDINISPSEFENL